MGKSKVICPICNKEFERETAKKKYCGTECRRLANIKHTRENQKMQHPGKVGRLKRSTDRRWSPAEIRQNQKEHYAGMAEHPPDQKASEDFHRPAYQANNMIRIQGQQLEHITVEEYLAKKYNIKEADAGGAETRRK